jgi:hypothetical protein
MLSGPVKFRQLDRLIIDDRKHLRLQFKASKGGNSEMPSLTLTTQELVDEARDQIDIAGILYQGGHFTEAAKEYSYARRCLEAASQMHRADACGELHDLIREEAWLLERRRETEAADVASRIGRRQIDLWAKEEAAVS